MSTQTNSSKPTMFGWAVYIYRHTKDRGWEMAGSDRVYASPCVGGVEIRQYRVRIRVFKDQAMSTASSSPSSTSQSSARCTKRRNLLFLSTTSRTGSIVLKFHSVEACNDFFDQLLDLNDRQQQGASYSESATVEEKECCFSREASRNSDVITEQDLNRRKQDTLLYLARLLHDDDFKDFVKNVENSLMSSKDGAKLLAAFQNSQETNIQP